MTDQPNTPDAPETDAAPEATEAAVPAPETPVVEAPADPVPAPKPVRLGTPPDGHQWRGTGRRKRAVARVRIRPGSGKFVVNDREMGEFFNAERDRNDLVSVLEKTNTAGQVDVQVSVRGGGPTGQAGAIVLGLGRALLSYDPVLESILRDNGFLTRDARQVERKKYGQPGARKRFQFSKR